MSHLSSTKTKIDTPVIAYEVPAGHIATVSLNVVNASERDATVSMWLTDSNDWGLKSVTVSSSGKGYARFPTLVVTPEISGATLTLHCELGSATLNQSSAGAGYTVDDIVSLPVAKGTAPTLRVTEVDGSGAIVNYVIADRGEFTELTTETPTTTPVVVTGGTGVVKANFTMALRVKRVAVKDTPEKGTPRSTTFALTGSIAETVAVLTPNFVVSPDSANIIEWNRVFNGGDVLYRNGFILSAGQGLTVQSSTNDVACSTWGIQEVSV